MDTSTYEILKECNSGCRMALNRYRAVGGIFKKSGASGLVL